MTARSTKFACDPACDAPDAPSTSAFGPSRARTRSWPFDIHALRDATLHRALFVAIALGLAGCGTQQDADGARTEPDDTTSATSELPTPPDPMVEARDDELQGGLGHPITAGDRPDIVAGAEAAPFGVAPPPGWEGKTWADVQAAGVGSTVRWALWAGDPRINDWVDDYVADVAIGRLGIELDVVPLQDTVDIVNKVAADKAAGHDPGSVDLIWINGENFHTLRQSDLLYGPWAAWTPASGFLDWMDASWQLDLGVPIEGYEMPWGRAVFVLVHDAETVPTPPNDLAALWAWIEDHPGRFTYPAPPDFTGSAFVRQVCRSLAPDPDVMNVAVDPQREQDVIEAATAPCWERLRSIAPSLWRAGDTYPAGLGQLNDLFANGEVDFDMNYNPSAASGFIEEGRYPDTARTFVLRDGMLANTHYLAIPWNAPNKAGAMALADLLGQPGAQVSKAQPDQWGDLSILDRSKLSEAWQVAVDELPRGPATLPLPVLSAAARPEPHASWVAVLEQGWEAEVLGR